MYSFFSPFVAGSYLCSEDKVQTDVAPECVIVAITVYEQFNRRVFLLTLNDTAIISRLFWDTCSYFKLSGHKIGNKPFLFIRPTSPNKTGEAKVIRGKTYTTLRSVDSVFLPKQVHKRTNVVAYIDVGSSQMAVTLPDTYNVKEESINDNEQPDFGKLYNKLMTNRI